MREWRSRTAQRTSGQSARQAESENSDRLRGQSAKRREKWLRSHARLDMAGFAAQVVRRRRARFGDRDISPRGAGRAEHRAKQHSTPHGSVIVRLVAVDVERGAHCPQKRFPVLTTNLRYASPTYRLADRFAHGVPSGACCVRIRID